MKAYSLKIHPSPKFELKESVNWYNCKRDGLGKEFMSEIEKTIITLRNNPKQFRIIGRDVRKATLKHFPYSIIFSVIDNKTIEVYSFFHHSRNPKIWKKRGKL